MITNPPPLPHDPRTTQMPEPFSREWNEWLPTVYRMTLDQMIVAAGCLVRGCKVEHAWDEEHRVRAFFHNGTPIGWSTYQSMQPAPQTDHEAFFRVVYDLHAAEDGRAGTLDRPPEPAETPEEKRAIDLVYAERDMCVSLIARLAVAAGYQAYLAVDETADEGWRHIVYVELPSGQVSWHLKDKELGWFRGLPTRPNKWDGHDTAEKYRRVLSAWPWEARG